VLANWLTPEKRNHTLRPYGRQSFGRLVADPTYNGAPQTISAS